MADNSSDDAAAFLRQAQALHGEGKIDAALAAARHALEIDSDYVPALSYLGTTLITRKLTYAPGLEALERAKVLAPDDPGVAYSLGWCYEFVAYRLEKENGRTELDPIDLYERAAAELQRCIDLKPEQGLADDAADLLAAVEQRLE